MKANPYRKPNYVLASSGEPVAGNKNLKGKMGSSARSTEPIIGRDGTFNATNKTELLKQISNLLHASANGEVVEATKHERMKQIMAEHRELIEAAKNDRTGEGFVALGQAIGNEIWETENRQGFARSILQIKPLVKGEDGKFRIRRKDVTAFVATGPSMAIESYIRQDWVYPKEFVLHARIWIDIIQLRQDTGDLLEDKYVDGLEQIMVGEDRILKTLADRAAQVRNDLVVFNTLSPQVLSAMRTQVMRWNLTPATVLLAVDLWDDIITDPTFTAWYSPVEQHQVILEGKLGSMMNMEIKTDGYRPETLRVLDPGDLYVFATANEVGGIAQGIELTAEPIQNYINGKPQQGWYMYQTEGMVVANCLGISRAVRA